MNRLEFDDTGKVSPERRLSVNIKNDRIVAAGVDRPLCGSVDVVVRGRVFWQGEKRHGRFHQVAHQLVPPRISLANLVIGARDGSPGPGEVFQPRLFRLCWILGDWPVFRVHCGSPCREDQPGSGRQDRASHWILLAKVVVNGAGG